MITRKELIKKYLEFFESKGHKLIPSASLIPENDPSVLFTTAGMHPLVPYLLGLKHPLGRRLVNAQKCIRTGDIEEVGDSYHHTFFEMLGNWSLGDYWKKEAIEYSFEFLTKILNIPKEKLAVTIFAGDENAPADIKSKKVWENLKIPKIIPLKEDNWWGPAGETGPCGPDTEMFFWKNNSRKVPKEFDPNYSTLATGKHDWVEIWNDVFMEYEKTEKGKFIPLKQKNVDTGMGVERMLTILNGLEDNYLTEVWKPIIKKIEKLSKKEYGKDEKITKAMRIISDHLKASVFILAEGVIPSNTERGYVLRRLIRRAIRYGRMIEIKNFTKQVVEPVFKIYDDYTELKKNKKKILEELEKEENRFLESLEKGLGILNIKVFEKEGNNDWVERKKIIGKKAFLLYQSYGFPIELTQELAKEKGYSIDIKGFQTELKKHQELSRTAAKGKFVAGLADHSDTATRYHTATHLLHKALKIILGNDVQQMGSNITQERLRFDFSFSRKLTKEEITKVEALVNKQIKRSLPVSYEEMPYAEAIKTGALSYFREKYPKIVKVYTVGDFSKEICTGPHVKNTKELGKFKITKEESSSAGVRRIKAILKK